MVGPAGLTIYAVLYFVACNRGTTAVSGAFQLRRSMLEVSETPARLNSGYFTAGGVACALEVSGVISTASKMAAVQMTSVRALALIVNSYSDPSDSTGVNRRTTVWWAGHVATYPYFE